VTANAGPSPLAERLLHVAAGLAALAQQHGADDVALTPQAGRALDELRTLVQEQKTAAEPLLVKMDDLAGQLLDDYQVRKDAARKNGGVVGVRTGLDHLDETLNGLEPGKLYIVGAQPGAGKTTLALQIAATIAQAGRPSVYFSLENDATDLARKTVSRLAGLSYADALKGKVAPATWQAGVGELAKLDGKLYLCTPRAVMPNLAEVIEQVIEQAGQPPALIVVDYLQAWVKRASGPASLEDGVRRHINQFTPALRALGERYGTAVLAISSQNRANYEEGGMSALKESGDIEYDADVVMTLQPCKVEKDAPLSPNKRVEIIINKNRQGLSGRPIKLLLRGDHCTLEEEDR